MADRTFIRGVDPGSGGVPPLPGPPTPGHNWSFENGRWVLVPQQSGGTFGKVIGDIGHGIDPNSYVPGIDKYLYYAGMLANLYGAGYQAGVFPGGGASAGADAGSVDPFINPGAGTDLAATGSPVAGFDVNVPQLGDSAASFAGAPTVGAGTPTGLSWLARNGKFLDAGLSSISGVLQAQQFNTANAEARRRFGRAEAAATPQHLTDTIAALQPLFRQLAAHGLGSAFQEAVAQNLALHGMTGTGTGEALRTASLAIPETTAFQGAQEAGQSLVNSQISTEIGAPAPQPNVNPFTAALLFGARGLISGSNFNNPMTANANPSPTPNLNPIRTNTITGLPNLGGPATTGGPGILTQP